MKLAIGPRLFLSLLAAIVVVAAAALELAHWKWFTHAAQRAGDGERARVAALGVALGERYRQHGDWSFLPTAASQRATWLRDELAQLPPDATAAAVAPTLGHRIGLLDRDERVLAGVVPHRLTITFASIDTRRQAIAVDGATVGYLVDAVPQGPEDELAVAFLVEQQGNLALIAAIAVGASAFLAALLAAYFRRPIRQLVAGARRLEQGQFDARLDSRRGDELGTLATAFDHLAEKLASAETARRHWVADTSHELRTPLSVLRAQMEALQDGVRAPTPETIASMLRQVQSLSRLVDELYQLARADVGAARYDFRPCAVWPLVVDAATAYAERFRAAGLDLTLGTAPARSDVRGDAERIRQVLVNLLENCARYTSAGGRVEVHGDVVDGALHIAIDDTEPGVPAPLLERLGERFFRVEASRSRQHGGAGLGLALARQIALAHGGRLDFAPSPLGGLRATLVLPLSADA